MTAPAYIVPLVGAALSLAGILLLRRGRWPRRVGTTPHCPKCDYILTDLIALPDQLPRCPECGTPATPWRIQLGERPIRPSFIWTGSSLTMLGILLLASLFSTSIRHFQWIHLQPLGWLLGDLESQNASVSRSAWNEIMRRENAGLLSEDEKSRIVNTGIHKKPSLVDSRGYNELATYIATRYRDSKLTAAQTNQFVDWITQARLIVRPVVGAESPLPYMVRSFGPTPEQWQLVMAISQTQLDDRVPERPKGGFHYDVNVGVTGAIEQHGASPGVHHLRVRVKLLPAPNLGAAPIDLDNPPPGQQVITRDLSGTFKVVEGQTPIAVLTTPDAAELSKKIHVGVSPTHGYRADTLSVYIQANELPCDAAFTVAIRARTREYPLGAWVAKKGTRIGTYWLPEEPKLDALDGAEIILRSDETIARRSVDLNEIWKGRIVIPIAKQTN